MTNWPAQSQIQWSVKAREGSITTGTTLNTHSYCVSAIMMTNMMMVDGDVLSAVGSTQFSGNKTQVLRDLSGPSPLVNLFCKTITMKTVGLVNQG